MREIKLGDIIIFRNIKKEVRAKIDNIIFLRTINDDGSVSPTNEYQEIEDLITYGYKKNE